MRPLLYLFFHKIANSIGAYQIISLTVEDLADDDPRVWAEKERLKQFKGVNE
jgi:hypothetical protein